MMKFSLLNINSKSEEKFVLYTTILVERSCAFVFMKQAPNIVIAYLSGVLEQLQIHS